MDHRDAVPGEFAGKGEVDTLHGKPPDRDWAASPALARALACSRLVRRTTARQYQPYAPDDDEQHTQWDGDGKYSGHELEKYRDPDQR